MIGGRHSSSKKWILSVRFRGRFIDVSGRLFVCGHAMMAHTMARWRLFIAYPLVWILSLGWFALFQPWGRFNDPDAFYHAKISALMSVQGPLHSFPWLDLTLFDKGFSDHHFLFHVLLIPFVRMFGMLYGNQVAAVVFAATCVTGLYVILRGCRFSAPMVWTALALFCSPLIIRLSLGKASPLAILFFLLGLFVMMHDLHRTDRMGEKSGLVSRLAPGFMIGFLYSWIHGGWIIVLVSQSILMLGSLLVDRVVLERSWIVAIKDLAWHVLVMTAVGAIFGTLLHPNFPQNVLFLKTLLFDISWNVPFQHVRLGDEWQPSTLVELWGGMGVLLSAGGIVLFGLVSASRRPLHVRHAKYAVGFGLLTALFFALTLKSRRASEYLIPVFVIWLASLWTLVDAKQCWQILRVTWQELVGKYYRVLFYFLIVLGFTLVTHDIVGTWRVMHTQVHPFGEYQEAMHAIANRAQPGDRVFHSDWDLFPQLWMLNDRVHFIVGLDPTLLWITDHDRSDAYRDIALGKTTDGVFEQIHDNFGARFVFLEKISHQTFERTLEADTRFVKIYDDPKVVVYELSTGAH